MDKILTIKIKLKKKKKEKNTQTIYHSTRRIILHSTAAKDYKLYKKQSTVQIYITYKYINLLNEFIIVN